MNRIFFDKTLTQEDFTEKTVMVFGANEKGFHGMGMAGLAFCNDRGNYRYWSKVNYQNLMSNGVGDFAISGKVGFMKGNKGYSYGLVTVSKPGTPLTKDNIVKNITSFYDVCLNNPLLTFVIPYNDNKNLNKYSLKDIVNMFKEAGDIPLNIKWGNEFNKHI